MSTIGIIGNGFVGRATSLLDKCLIYDKDPKLSNATLEQVVKSSDILFICVPTPSLPNGDCDTRIVKSVLEDIRNVYNHPCIVCRSTVPVGFCQQNNIFFMPEFLTEKNWKDDFFTCSLWIFGGHDTAFQMKMSTVIFNAHKEHRIQHSNMAFVTTSEAEAIKYFRNAFLATKISFSNEFYRFCKKQGIDYEQVRYFACQDSRIGNSHTAVPGHDGKFGFGGTCLPKDTLSLRNQMQDSIIVDAVVRRNETVDRPEKDWLADAGRAVSNTQETILVTGGAGFIGTNLVNYLRARGEHVTVIDNFISSKRKDGVLEMDICDIDPTRFKNIKAIYHLACPASPIKYQADPIHTIRTCVEGTRRVLEIARLNKCKILLTSTSEVYGEPLVTPQPESYRGNVNTVGIRACYDEGKRIAETLFFEYRKHCDTKIVRIFNTYGKFLDPDDGRVVTNFLKQAKAGDDITIYGDGSQTRSFCYVDDMVDGLVKMMNSDEPGPINLGNPHEQTVLSIAKQIIELTGSTSKIVFCDLPKDDPTNRCPDITLAKERLHWSPKISFKEGIIAMLTTVTTSDEHVEGFRSNYNG